MAASNASPRTRWSSGVGEGVCCSPHIPTIPVSTQARRGSPSQARPIFSTSATARAANSGVRYSPTGRSRGHRRSWRWGKSRYTRGTTRRPRRAYGVQCRSAYSTSRSTGSDACSSSWSHGTYHRATDPYGCRGPGRWGTSGGVTPSGGQPGVTRGAHGIWWSTSPDNGFAKARSSEAGRTVTDAAGPAPSMGRQCARRRPRRDGQAADGLSPGAPARSWP